MGSAFAGQDESKQQVAAGPVEMTDAQMDSGAAGALVNVFAVDLIDVNNVLNNNQVSVNVPLNAAVAVGVLGDAAAGAAQQARFNQQR